MTISLVFILIAWLIFIGFTVLLSLVNLFHILHYGFWTFQSALFAFLYYGTALIILFWVWQQLPQFDWTAPLFTFGLPSFNLPSSL